MQERKKLDDLIHLIGGGKLESELRELHVLPQKEAQAGDDTEHALGECVNGKLVSLHRAHGAVGIDHIDFFDAVQDGSVTVAANADAAHGEHAAHGGGRTARGADARGESVAGKLFIEILPHDAGLDITGPVLLINGDHFVHAAYIDKKAAHGGHGPAVAGRGLGADSDRNPVLVGHRQAVADLLRRPRQSDGTGRSFEKPQQHRRHFAKIMVI